MIAYVTGNNTHFTTLRWHIDLGCACSYSRRCCRCWVLPSPIFDNPINICIFLCFCHVASIISPSDVRHNACFLRFLHCFSSFSSQSPSTSSSSSSQFLLFRCSIFASSMDLNTFVYVCIRTYHSYSFDIEAKYKTLARSQKGSEIENHTHSRKWKSTGTRACIYTTWTNR